MSFGLGTTTSTTSRCDKNRVSPGHCLPCGSHLALLADLYVPLSQLIFTIVFSLELSLWCIACGLLVSDQRAGQLVEVYFESFPQAIGKSFSAARQLLLLARWPRTSYQRRLEFRPAFVHLRPAYLLVHWNILDFMVVLTSWPSLFAGSGSTVGVLRLLRLLKPLRTVKMMPGMQAMSACGMEVAVRCKCRLVNSIPKAPL